MRSRLGLEAGQAATFILCLSLQEPNPISSGSAGIAPGLLDWQAGFCAARREGTASLPHSSPMEDGPGYPGVSKVPRQAEVHVPWGESWWAKDDESTSGSSVCSFQSVLFSQFRQGAEMHQGGNLKMTFQAGCGGLWLH